MCCNDEQRKGLIRKNNYQPPPVFRTTSENAPILNSSIFGVRMGDVYQLLSMMDCYIMNGYD